MLSQMEDVRNGEHVQEPEATTEEDQIQQQWCLDAALADLERDRQFLKGEEKKLGFEYSLAARPEEHEETVNSILQNAKIIDDYVFKSQPGQTGFNGQQHPRFAGDHFLSNKGLIDKSLVYQIARRLPKGAHLHIHFNSCLKPDVLLDVAKEQDDMWISSDRPLTSDADLKLAKLRFSMKGGLAECAEGNLFLQQAGVRTWQNFKEFLDVCDIDTPRISGGAMAWLRKKLVFGVEETHNLQQSTAGGWELFNARTQMLKGLFNYEDAYRQYTRRCLEGFVAENIQYAEVRPNFVKTNHVWKADGSTKLDNQEIVQMIIDVVEEFQDTEFGKDFLLKIIYCCPRSFAKEQVSFGLNECFEFKKKWPKWIAGFDLVGEESKGHPLQYFHSEFLEFQHKCQAANLDIPFLFHCGETLDEGTETDGNLLDALLLKSKRIGHGFALVKHPFIMQRMKEENVCLELCPISNEILGLTPRVTGHPMYTLLANNLHCTVNSDNGTLFNSTLSHDFYQVMVGKSDMTLWGWKQLIKWSLEHSVWVEGEQDKVTEIWEEKWSIFLEQIMTLQGPIKNAVEAIKASAAADYALKAADAALTKAKHTATEADTAGDRDTAVSDVEEIAATLEPLNEVSENARNDTIESIETALNMAEL